MTPKEFDFMVGLIEEVTIRAYAHGHADATAGKPLKTDGFKMAPSSRLTLKTKMSKHTQKR